MFGTHYGPPTEQDEDPTALTESEERWLDQHCGSESDCDVDGGCPVKDGCDRYRAAWNEDREDR